MLYQVIDNSYDESYEPNQDEDYYFNEIIKHRNAAHRKFCLQIDLFISKRLSIMKACGVKATGSFYDDMQEEISEVIKLSLAEYFING